MRVTTWSGEQFDAELAEDASAGWIIDGENWFEVSASGIKPAAVLYPNSPEATAMVERWEAVRAELVTRRERLRGDDERDGAASALSVQAAIAEDRFVAQGLARDAGQKRLDAMRFSPPEDLPEDGKAWLAASDPPLRYAVEGAVDVLYGEQGRPSIWTLSAMFKVRQNHICR